MIKRLRLKFIWINMAIVTVILMTVFGMVLHFTMSGLEAQSTQALRAVMEDSRGSFALPGQRHEEVRLPFFYVSINPFGEVTASAGGYFDLSDQAALETIISEASASGEEMGLLRQYNLRFYKKATPFGASIAFVDVSSELAMVKSLVKNCAMIGALSFLAFLSLSVLLSRWAVAPVDKAWNQQRQFVADASHELKTPLTVIMTNAELLTSPEYDEAQRGQFVSSILDMSHQMRGLVESLLELARVDNGAAKMEFGRLDFSGLVEDALLPFEPVYFEKGLVLESWVEENLFVRGSAAHLKQVTEILLDNAAKYSDPEGTVTVRVRQQGSACLLSVASPGGAISQEDLKNIFKRFYRIDKARTRDGSYGLGLSIADRIVREHGGKIWAESAAGINTFFIQLPAV